MEEIAEVKKMEEPPETCSSRVVSVCEESGDEELSVLPRHTKVIVTGNNRTKSVLVGLQGVVKKAVGLGGWHWLVLKNGVEVKLQRNALSVLEHPTGEEVDDEHEFDISSSSSDIGQKDNGFADSLFHKRNKVRVRHPKPWVPPAKLASRVSCKPQTNLHKPQTNVYTPHLKVNLEKLGMSSLWRYGKYYNLVKLSPATNGNPGYSKHQLIKLCQSHFLSERLKEVEVIREFIDAAKRLKQNNK